MTPVNCPSRRLTECVRSAFGFAVLAAAWTLAAYEFAEPARAQEAASRWTIYTSDSGLTSDDVRTVFEDSTGTIWVGTRGGGVGQYRGDTWRWFGVADGLASDGVLAFVEGSDGRLWAAGGGGVSQFDGERWATTSFEGLTPNAVFSGSRGRDGVLWFGSTVGALRFEDDDWLALTMDHGLPHPVVHDVLRDTLGALWYATRGGGLAGFSDVTWLYDFEDLNVRRLLEDDRGDVWVGTSGAGVLRLGPDGWEAFEESSTLLPCVQDRDGRVWFATDNDGALRFSGSRWLRIGVADGPAQQRRTRHRGESRRSALVRDRCRPGRPFTYRWSMSLVQVARSGGRME